MLFVFKDENSTGLINVVLREAEHVFVGKNYSYSILNETLEITFSSSVKNQGEDEKIIENLETEIALENTNDNIAMQYSYANDFLEFNSPLKTIVKKGAQNTSPLPEESDTDQKSFVETTGFLILVISLGVITLYCCYQNQRPKQKEKKPKVTLKKTTQSGEKMEENA